MAAQKELARPIMTTCHPSSAMTQRRPADGAPRDHCWQRLTQPCLALGLALMLGACNGRLIVVNRSGVGGANQEQDAGTDVVGTDDSGKQRCTADSECSSKVCRAGYCRDAECDDGVQNGLETGIDCGGGRCRACSTSCVCASSDALMVFGCDPRPDSPNITSIPQLSDDGSVVLLESSVGGNSQVYFWTAETGMRPLKGTEGGAPLGMSGDGRLLLVRPNATGGDKARVYRLDGSSVSTGLQTDLLVSMGSDGSVAGSVSQTGSTSLARWTEARGTEVLAPLPNPFSVSILGVGPDAASMVGSGYGQTGYTALRWTDAAGLVLDLGPLPAGADHADIRSVSRDAAIVAGLLYSDRPVDNGGVLFGVFRYTPATGIAQLGDPSFGFYDTHLSADGSTLAGIMGKQNYRWTADSGVVPLELGQHPIGQILLSADGKVLLNENADGGDDALLMWDTEHGTRSVRTALTAQGVDFSGWGTIGSPRQLSSDGKIAVGYGTCGSRPVVYRIVLPN